MSKLQNIKAVRQMLDGTHKTQTKTILGEFEKKHSGKREVGEKWIDEEGREWEQKEGYRIQKDKMSEVRKYLRSARNCPKEDKTFCKFGKHRLDKKYNTVHGMCMDCSLKAEDKMRAEGTWEEFQRTKIKQNAMDWIRETNQRIEQMKKDVGENPTIVHESGRIETFKATWDSKALQKSIDKEWSRVQDEVMAHHNISKEELENYLNEPEAV